ncbi:CRE-GUR-4 protein [Ditylenchus destructor]|uniref:CRE-GUR-4 protein n=1 Tax=Ditylenchus destructor TaxID=166010 RepID=A0AAD4QZX4_9BILA|nr:CRE-GUR-4 protein [Ditylenchus destructor]
MWTQPVRHTVENLNIEFLLECAWLLQAISTMAFLIHWQREGFIDLLMAQVIIRTPKKGETPPEEYLKVKRMTRRLMFVCAVLVINFAAIVTTFVMNHVEDWNEPYMGLHRFDFAYAIISIYGFTVFNLTLIIFVVTVQCVLIQLQDFNRKLKAVLSTSIASTDNRLTLPDRLLEMLEMHNKLADKIHLVDSMFRAYTFTSMAFGIPTSVLALIVLIRRRMLLALYYSFNDTACCTFQMLGLTIVPAQIYMEFRSVHNILYRNSALWKNYDARFYQISRTFAKSAMQTNTGITLGGFIPITKSLILSSLSLILPYVMLCLQLHVGTNYITSSNVHQNEMMSDDEPFDKFPVLLWADLLN